MINCKNKTVDDYGADPTGVKDSTPAFYAMHEATEGSIISGSGVYRVQELCIDKSTKYLDTRRSELLNISEYPMISTRGTVRSACLMIGKATHRVQSGPMIKANGLVSNCQIHVIDSNHVQENSPMIKVHSSDGGRMFSNVVHFNRVYRTDQPKQPVLDVLVDGVKYSGNRHQFNFVWGNRNAPVFSVRNTGAAHIVNNTFEKSIVESAQAGVMYLTGQNKTTVREFTSHDIQEYESDQYVIGSDGLSSRTMLFDTVGALSGKKQGFKTFDVSGCIDTTFLNCNGHNSGGGRIDVEFGGRYASWLGRSNYLSASNDSNVTYL